MPERAPACVGFWEGREILPRYSGPAPIEGMQENPCIKAQEHAGRKVENVP